MAAILSKSGSAKMLLRHSEQLYCDMKIVVTKIAGALLHLRFVACTGNAVEYQIVAQC